MLMTKLYTGNYKHQYSFKFKDKEYMVHSIVRLTEEGRRYLGARNKEVILTEQFINWNGVTCWKYEFKSIEATGGITNKSTDRPPDKLIEEVVMPATPEYTQREILGVSLAPSKTAIKHTKKDWEIPEVRIAWIIYIIIFFAVAIFKDWHVQLIIRVAAGWYLGIYRQAYVNAYTTYTYEEDKELIRKKYDVLYGFKNSDNDK